MRVRSRLSTTLVLGTALALGACTGLSSSTFPSERPIVLQRRAMPPRSKAVPVVTRATEPVTCNCGPTANGPSLTTADKEALFKRFEAQQGQQAAARPSAEP